MPRPGSVTSMRSAASFCCSSASRSSGCALVEQRFDLLLGLVERLAAARLGVAGQRRQRLHQRGQRAALAEEGGLGVGQLRLLVGSGDLLPRLADDRFQIGIHVVAYLGVSPNETGPGRPPKRSLRSLRGLHKPRQADADQAAEAGVSPIVDLTCSTMALKAGLSLTASSARTLRSSSISAFIRPFMNTL